MYNFLLISSNEGSGAKSLEEQINYLQSFSIKVTLLIDPTELELVSVIEHEQFEAAYVHIKRRVINDSYNYDPVKLLEYYEIPIVGNHYITQLLIADKCLTSKASGIGLPNIIITREMWNSKRVPENIESTIGFPMIIKPNSLHASQGISQNSVVHNNDMLIEQVGNIFSRFEQLHEVLIEKYIESGTEYTVAVLGNSDSLACSVTKLEYKDSTKYHIYSETDKESSLDERNVRFVVEESQQIRNRLEALAKSLFKHFKMKDIARFDFIKSDTYFLLEANCCPIPGNSFSWEWQDIYGLKKHQVLSLYLCAFHFAQISSGRPDNLPFSLIYDLPQDIINQICFPKPIDVKPECTEITPNCKRPQMYSMNSRVGSENEVLSFLRMITILLKPEVILETGTYKGNGTISFAEGIMFNNFGKVISIECDEKLAEIMKNKFDGYPVEIVCGNSLEYTPTNKIDILFLDSKRSLRKNEFIRFKPFLHENSLIIWHDSAYRERHHEVYDGVEELYRAGIIDRILLPTPRGITLSMLKKQNKPF